MTELVMMWRVSSALIVVFLWVNVTMPFTVGEAESTNIHNLLVNNGGTWLLVTLGFAIYFWVAYLGAKACVTVEEKGQETLVSEFSVVAMLAYFVSSFVAWAMADPDSGFLAQIVGVFAMAATVLAGIFLLPLFLFFVLVCLPYFFVAIYSVFITSKTTEIAKKHVNKKRPNDVIESELANAMASGLKSDFELQKIINELSPTSRFINTLTYKKKAEKYREMRKLMDAQVEASVERDTLGESAHQLERRRRE